MVREIHIKLSKHVYNKLLELKEKNRYTWSEPIDNDLRIERAAALP